jgi:3-oxoacyl-ACP reductase-like protein
MMRAVSLVLTLAGGVACASAQTAAPARAAAPASAPASAADTVPRGAPQAPDWLVADSTARTVTLALRVTPAPDGGAALINGHRSGDLQIIVPLGWTVQWDWQSADSTAPHSLVVMAEREKLPTEGGRAVFTNAMTRMLTDGLRPGQGDRTTFAADQAGWYWMLCGVPGHALEGEYLGLRVDPEAATAGVKLKAG